MKANLVIKERWRRFLEWRERPYQVAPISEKENECATCHTIYKGNYCPRCGQSSRIGRYSFKTVFLNFLDVWGLGNRGMFRTIRDLVLRPGYMIRDYLNGMQMAYFPPIKMFFLLAALSILVTHGFNIKGERYTEWEISNPTVESGGEIKLVNISDDGTEESMKVNTKAFEVIKEVVCFAERFITRFPSIFALLVLMGVSWFLFLFFRHCPKIPDLRYSEFFISLVYADNMYTIYAILLGFFGFPNLSTLATLLVVIPLKQLSGYSLWQTIRKTLAAFAILLLLLNAIVIVVTILLLSPM